MLCFCAIFAFVAGVDELQRQLQRVREEHAVKSETQASIILDLQDRIRSHEQVSQPLPAPRMLTLNDLFTITSLSGQHHLQ